MTRNALNKNALTASKLKPLPGYPRKEAFTAIEDIEAYLSGEKVVCLLCGREYVALGGHLTRAHGLSNDDYRMRFGIPFRYGLAAKPFRKRGARHIARLRRDGRMSAAPSKATIKKMHQARRKRRAISEATRQQNLDKLRRIHRKQEFWTPADFREFFRRIKSGRTVLEVESDEDMPRRHSFLAYLKNDPALQKQYEQVWETLPFAVQVRANKTGDRYRRTLVRLRLSGKTWDQVGQIMGVNPSAVRNMWHLLKRRGELNQYVPQSAAA